MDINRLSAPILEIADSDILKPNEDSGFKLRFYEDIKINGKNIDPDKVYEYDKWYIVIMPIKAGTEFNKIRFGADQNTNTIRLVAIGEGMEFIEGDISRIGEKAAALMTKYGVQQ